MSKKITITFTDQQVLCLIYAASEVMDHNSEGFFPELNRRKPPTMLTTNCKMNIKNKQENNDELR